MIIITVLFISFCLSQTACQEELALLLPSCLDFVDSQRVTGLVDSVILRGFHQVWVAYRIRNPIFTKVSKYPDQLPTHYVVVQRTVAGLPW